MRIMRFKRFKEFKDTLNPKAKLGHNGDGRTLSEVVLEEDGKVIFECFGMEPAGPSTTEAKKDRRIPADLYTAIWEPSTAAGSKIKGKLPLIYNDKVPKSRAIRIHIGNYGKDTLGCKLLGLGCNKETGTIHNSTAAIKKLIDLWYDLPFKIEITEISKES